MLRYVETAYIYVGYGYAYRTVYLLEGTGCFYINLAGELVNVDKVDGEWRLITDLF